MKRSKLGVDFSRIDVLRNLDEAVLDDLKKVSSLMYLKSGEYLNHDIEDNHAFYMVQSGGVRILEHSADGNSVGLKIYGEGDVFGMVNSASSRSGSRRINALKDTEIIAICGDDARQVMERHAQLGVKMVELLVQDVHEAQNRIRHMAVDRVDKRLARALLQYCAKFGEVDDLNGCTHLKLSQQDIAIFVRTTVETINRTLREWERYGIVACARRRVIVLEHDSLELIAAGEYSMV